MAAYEIPNLRFSGEAGGLIFRRRFVTINEQEQVVQVTANTDSVVGVSSLPAKLAQVAEIYDGIVMVEAAEQIVAGSKVMADADAKAVLYVEGANAVCAGVAITNAGADGELLSVKL